MLVALSQAGVVTQTPTPASQIIGCTCAPALPASHVLCDHHAVVGEPLRAHSLNTLLHGPYDLRRAFEGDDDLRILLRPRRSRMTHDQQREEAAKASTSQLLHDSTGGSKLVMLHDAQVWRCAEAKCFLDV
ncbi:MAG: hypothetical protein H8K04_10490 [Nitrospira sp.]